MSDSHGGQSPVGDGLGVQVSSRRWGLGALCARWSVEVGLGFC